MEENEARVGFKIASSGDSEDWPVGITAGAADPHIYVLVGKRARFKDRFNKKAWTLRFSGSTSAGSTGEAIMGIGAPDLVLTDDSATTPAIATPGGLRYNIVSGSLGNPYSSSAWKTYGWFYPEMGCMVFSGAQLSASIPGQLNSMAPVASFNAGQLVEDVNYTASIGFSPNLANNINPKNALRFINAMGKVDGNTFRMRSEEDQTQENYFCRIKANDYNFSSNPTFVSGSLNKLRHTTMIGNPTSFITGLGLYNASGQLLATARLSSPLKKNFASEATIKVKLTY